jgi:excisionase family DNA binding protein
VKSGGLWLTATEAAERLGIHNNTAKRIPPDELPYFRVAARGDRRYRLEDVEAYIERRMVRD